MYILGFGLAELLHLPGMVFVVAGVLCWGHVNGWLLALVMAPLSCSISFLVIRRIGGQVLAEVQWSVMQRIMAGPSTCLLAHKHPLQSYLKEVCTSFLS